MTVIDQIYSGKVTQDAEGVFYNIFKLCKVGIAAGDTAAGIDLTEGGYDTLFEAIAALALDGIERL